MFAAIPREDRSSWSVSELPEVYGYRAYNLEVGGYSYVRDA